VRGRWRKVKVVKRRAGKAMGTAQAQMGTAVVRAAGGGARAVVVWE